MTDTVTNTSLVSYRLTATDCVIRVSDGACIPADPANTDYAAYLAWVDGGGVPEPYVAPPPPPPPSPVASVYGVANLTIANGEITGFELGRGIAGGYQAGTGEFWLFLADTLATGAYQVQAWDDARSVQATVAREDRFTDQFCVRCTSGGQPADPATLNIQIIRVI